MCNVNVTDKTFLVHLSCRKCLSVQSLITIKTYLKKQAYGHNVDPHFDTMCNNPPWGLTKETNMDAYK